MSVFLGLLTPSNFTLDSSLGGNNILTNFSF